MSDRLRMASSDPAATVSPPVRKGFRHRARPGTRWSTPPREEDRAAAGAASPPRRSPTRAIVSLNDRRYVLDGPVASLGRSRECDCVFDDQNVSRRHAELRRNSSGDWQVVDLGSTNGVKVNGRRVDTSRLAPGDDVSLGTVSFTFDIEQ